MQQRSIERQKSVGETYANLTVDGQERETENDEQLEKMSKLTDRRKRAACITGPQKSGLSRRSVAR